MSEKVFLYCCFDIFYLMLIVTFKGQEIDQFHFENRNTKTRDPKKCQDNKANKTYMTTTLTRLVHPYWAGNSRIDKKTAVTMCDQRRLRLDCAPAQSDDSHRCPHETSRSQRFYIENILVNLISTKCTG